MIVQSSNKVQMCCLTTLEPQERKILSTKGSFSEKLEATYSLHVSPKWEKSGLPTLPEV
jgi:hypothetical protein